VIWEPEILAVGQVQAVVSDWLLLLRWRQWAPPKWWYPTATLHGITNYKAL